MVVKRHRPYSQLKPLPIPKEPITELSIDFIIGLPLVIFEEREVDTILMIVNRYIKYSFFFPVTQAMTAGDLAELFHHKIELIYRPPSRIMTDRGSLFVSKF